MPEPAKYRVGVIGRTGKGNYGHGIDTVWLNHPRAEIVAVADPDEKGRAEAVKRLGAKAGYADFREMLKNEKPRIVSVCDRHLDLHRDYVVACAEHGASMFLEKPLARTLAEADEMVTACDKHHVKCAIAHQTRSSPRVKVVRDLIASGTIGDVLELRGHGKCDGRGGGEDLTVLGTHTFDLMRYLAGDATWCSARISVGGRKAVAADVKQLGEGIGPGVGDHIVASYGFAGLTVGSFTTHKSKDAPSSKYWLEVRGSKGQIHLGFGAFPPAYLNLDPTWMPGAKKTEWQPITSAGVGKPEPLKPAEVGNGNRWIVDDLIDAIEKDRPPLGGIADGRAALEMILAVYESHRHERLVDLPLKNRKHPLSGW
jgi:predicted dehydrogenase